MKKLFIVITLAAALAACDRKPYVEHKVQLDKQAGDCSSSTASFRMTANLGGERYEFPKCLAADFTKEQMKVSRQGDTVVVSFDKPAASRSLYTITLDIDSYPQYNFLTIDDETYSIVYTGN